MARRADKGGQRLRPPLRKSLLGRFLAVSALVAACSVAATAWLKSRRAAGLAALSLVLAGAALITYASIRQLTLGVAYAVRADDYWPKVSKGWGMQLGDGYWFRGERIPLAEVWVRPSTLAVKVMKDPLPAPGLASPAWQPVTYLECGEYSPQKPQRARRSQMSHRPEIAM